MSVILAMLTQILAILKNMSFIRGIMRYNENEIFNQVGILLYFQ